jgi:hypothetical protein
MSPASPRPGNPDLLRLNGIEYVADWVIDDLPQDTPRLTAPSPQSPIRSTNDIVIRCAAASAFRAIPETLHRSVRPAISRRRVERPDHGDIDSPLHHGVLHRIKYLEALLDYVLFHDGCTDDGQRDWRLVSCRDGKELNCGLPQDRGRSGGLCDPLTRTCCRPHNKPTEAAANSSGSCRL